MGCWSHRAKWLAVLLLLAPHNVSFPLVSIYSRHMFVSCHLLETPRDFVFELVFVESSRAMEHGVEEKRQAGCAFVAPLCPILRSLTWCLMSAGPPVWEECKVSVFHRSLSTWWQWALSIHGDHTPSSHQNLLQSRRKARGF